MSVARFVGGNSKKTEVGFQLLYHIISINVKAPLTPEDLAQLNDQWHPKLTDIVSGLKLVQGTRQSVQGI